MIIFEIESTKIKKPPCQKGGLNFEIYCNYFLAYRLLNLSIRPAVSTITFLPV